jgi:hypothetical protein
MVDTAMVGPQGGSFRSVRRVVVAKAAAAATAVTNGESITRRNVHTASGPGGKVSATARATAESRRPTHPEEANANDADLDTAFLVVALLAASAGGCAGTTGSKSQVTVQRPPTQGLYVVFDGKMGRLDDTPESLEDRPIRSISVPISRSDPSSAIADSPGDAGQLDCCARSRMCGQTSRPAARCARTRNPNGSSPASIRLACPRM